MVEKGQDVQGCQERGELLFAMTEVMFQVIALGLERIIVFVFDFPTGAAGGGKGGDVLVGDREIGYPAIEVEHLALGVGLGEFTPVDPEGILAFGQGHRVGIAIGVGMEVGSHFGVGF